MRSAVTVLFALWLVAGCTSDGGAGGGGADVASDVASDVVTSPDAAADGLVAVPDTVSDTVSDTVAAPDTDTVSDTAPAPDTDSDVPPPCEDGVWACSDDAHVLRTCESGAWVETDCFRGEGWLCESGACVAPWRFGDPQWSACPDETRGTAETLAAKAAYYDDIAMRVHVHPTLKWINNVRLKWAEVECPAGATPPCRQPIVPEQEATWEDVESWRSGENDGLWSALYLASQAYRYAATGDAAALANLRVLMDGEQVRMRITGVAGNFTRQFVPPGVDGLSCPGDDGHYTTDVEKDDNRWVQIREDGCVWVIPNETGAWTKTDHCGLDEFAGWCFLDNVSQDEYAGHMFALGTVAKLVDDEEVRGAAVDMLEQIAEHLVANDMAIVDWDGRLTEHGRLYPTSFTDAPGFAAVLGYNYVQMGAYLTGRDDLDTFRRECLLQETGAGRCLPWPLETGKSWLTYLSQPLLYVGIDDCKTNFNNVSMLIAGYHTMIWFEEDPELRATFQDAFDRYVMRDPNARIPAITYRNAWYDFIWAANKALGPSSDGPAYQAVEDAVCSLKQFPASQAVPGRRPSDLYPHFCDGRLGGSMTETPVPVADRCPSTFLWWGGGFDRNNCTASPFDLEQPGDYLVAYWMGRYYGFIPVEL